MPPDNRGRPSDPQDKNKPRHDGVRNENAVPSYREDVVAAVLSGDPAGIDELAEGLAMRLVKRKLNSSQIRNFYGPIANLRTKKDEWRKKAFRMHRSRLAYLVARADGRADELWEVFGELLKRAEGPQIDAVCDLAEAVVAYHRYYDEQEKNR
jgi:CRISPR type III-A-associated protein Csm2